MNDVKSRLAEKGFGFCFVDTGSKGYKIGEDSYELLKDLPADRIDDVVYIKPRDISGYSIGINPMNVYDGLNSDTLIQQNYNNISKLILDNSGKNDFNPKPQDILTGIILSMIRSETNYDLSDLRKLLKDGMNNYKSDLYCNLIDDEDDEFMLECLESLQDAQNYEIEPLYNGVNTIVNSTHMNNAIVNQRDNIKFDYIIKNDKILILDLSKVQNMLLRSTIIDYVLNNLHMLCFKRKDLGLSRRSPFITYTNNLDCDIYDNNEVFMRYIEGRYRSSHFYINYANKRHYNNLKTMRHDVMEIENNILEDILDYKYDNENNIYKDKYNNNNATEIVEKSVKRYGSKK